MVSKSGKIRSYSSYVRNVSMKINRDNIGSTFDSKKVIYKEDKNGKKIFDRIEITKFKNDDGTIAACYHEWNDDANPLQILKCTRFKI